MFRDEYVVCFKFSTPTGAVEPNPDFDKKKGVCWNNMPNKLIKEMEWIVGADGPDNLGIRLQQSFRREEDARNAANAMARKHSRKEKF